jgi:DNA-binding Lrp family transcriptional regulator
MKQADMKQAIVHAMQDGLALTPRPFAAIAERLGTDEETVLDVVRELQATGTIKRFGVVVRHHELGFCANAMVVWDAPDESVHAIARRLAEDPDVTLCYRRPRRPPSWPYNLFCMIHGRDRVSVERKISTLRSAHGIQNLPHCILFSRRRFKQRGANYVSPVAATEACANG